MNNNFVCGICDLQSVVHMQVYNNCIFQNFVGPPHLAQYVFPSRMKTLRVLLNDVCSQPSWSRNVQSEFPNFFTVAFSSPRLWRSYVRSLAVTMRPISACMASKILSFLHSSNEYLHLRVNQKNLEYEKCHPFHTILIVCFHQRD